MFSNTKILQSKPVSEKKGGSSPKPPGSRIDQIVTPNGHPTTDHQHLQTSHILFTALSEGPPASITQPPSRCCVYCFDLSMDVQLSYNCTSAFSQQCHNTKDLFTSKSGSGHHANCPLNSTNQRRDEVHLPMTMENYSHIGRWEAQTPAEDAWSSFVALANGARKPVGERLDVLREQAIGDVFQM